MSAGIYIHIPFCAAKCVYCDFLSFSPDRLPKADIMARYTDALVAELHAAHTGALQNTVIDTIYVGGGTPTALPAPFLHDILREVQQFAITDSTEFTVEANPGTLTDEKLAVLRASGVNRLSLGVQAWQDPLLQRLGRIHSQAEAVAQYRAAQDAGFDNINVDLMFALPGQTLEDWLESLTQIVRLQPAHISAYSLTPEENTPLWHQIRQGRLTLPDDETDRAMYALGNRFLASQGYIHYELSNYARAGRESRHNSRYWTREAYWGFGLGAHSFDGHARWHNTEDMARYIKNPGHSKEEYTPIFQADAMAETMFLGLRLTAGVSELFFYQTFGVSLWDVYGEALARLQKEGLLLTDDGRVRLTSRGMDLANQVFMAFV